MAEIDPVNMEAALRQVLTAPGLGRPRYAVVAPLVWESDEPWLLLEVRAAGISQAGDPCFPGGRVEPGESPAQAAARELDEELGIRTDPETFLGRLPTVRTYLGAQTEVFVCALSGAETTRLRPNPAEVAQVLRVPLQFFLERAGADSFSISGHRVWGMTAGAIRHLCRAWNQVAAPLP